MFQAHFSLVVLLLSFLASKESLAGLNRGKNDGVSRTFQANSKGARNQARLSQTRGLVRNSRDGRINILPMTAVIGKFALQFKISVEKGSDDLNPEAKAGGVIQALEVVSGTSSDKGINVLLHGDGGKSYFDFPNNGFENNLFGVVVLAPNDNLVWGGGSGDRRTDGALHSNLLNELIRKVLPQVLNINPDKTFFMGISGGSLLLSGFFLPTFGDKYLTGVILGCGALSPQVDLSPKFGESLKKIRVHFQTTTDELGDLQAPIADSIGAYIKIGTDAGVSDEILGKKITADATPKAKHCAFDGRNFVSGVKLLADNYGNIIFRNGKVPGIGNVAKNALENTQKFASGLPIVKLKQI